MGRVDISRTGIEDAIFRQVEELRKLSDRNRETAIIISEAVEQFDTAKRLPEIQRHVHGFDYKTVRIAVVFTVLVAMILVFFFTVRNLKRDISGFMDNDLKYRYIQMQGEASPDDILMLREVFDYGRDASAVKEIRQKVEHYERLIKEQAEREARAKLNTEQAERLKIEAESIRIK